MPFGWYVCEMARKLQNGAEISHVIQEFETQMDKMDPQVVLRALLPQHPLGHQDVYKRQGMGCPGGCIGGAGTIADPARTAIQLNKYMKEAPFTAVSYTHLNKVSS